MVWFVGAGSGAADLITLKGMRLLGQADTIIYAGSLVNPALLDYGKPGARVCNSAHMTLEGVLEEMSAAHRQGSMVVRLHTGDPSLYGAVREQIDGLAARSIPYGVVPGVSSFCGAAASLGAEYTLPGVSQSLIITRLAGRTAVPDLESIASFAAHRSSMAIFLSSGMMQRLQKELLKGGYPPGTPAAVVYKATWPDELVLRCKVSTIADTAQQHRIHKTALVLVGDFLEGPYERSKLYDPSFSTAFRAASMGCGEESCP